MNTNLTAIKTIAFVPVRGGSKSIPFKNIKAFCGKPLIYWSLKALQAAAKVDEIIIATDSQEIEDAVTALEFGKVKVYNRSEENAQDASSTESVMLEYLADTDGFQNADLFMLVQATSPFTLAPHFDEALEVYTKEGYESLLSVCRIKRFFWNKAGQPINYDFQNRPRRQDFEGYLMEDGAFYINTVGNILKHKNRLSGKIGTYEMPEYTGLELDEPSDWIIGEALMKKYILSTEETSD